MLYCSNETTVSQEFAALNFLVQRVKCLLVKKTSAEWDDWENTFITSFQQVYCKQCSNLILLVLVSSRNCWWYWFKRNYFTENVFKFSFPGFWLWVLIKETQNLKSVLVFFYTAFKSWCSYCASNCTKCLENHQKRNC